MRRVVLVAVVISFGLLLCLRSNAEPGRKKAPADQVKNESKLITVTYAVADLVVPIAYNLEEAVDGKQSGKTTQEATLMRLICATVAPNSWEKVNAWGKEDAQTAIQFYPLGMGLVVRQSLEVQEEIAALLVSLRRLQDVQVSMDIRIRF